MNQSASTQSFWPSAGKTKQTKANSWELPTTWSQGGCLAVPESRAQPAARGDPNSKDAATHRREKEGAAVGSHGPQQVALRLRDTCENAALGNHSYVGIGSEKTLQKPQSGNITFYQ